MGASGPEGPVSKSKKPSASDVAAVRATVDRAVDVLREDPARMKRLLRQGADLADEIAKVLEDADEPDAAGKVALVAKGLKGATLLPAVLATALIKKTLGKLLERAG
jgi:hypothetical protein